MVFDGGMLCLADMTQRSVTSEPENNGRQEREAEGGRRAAVTRRRPPTVMLGCVVVAIMSHGSHVLFRRSRYERA